ncbi:hypothetical protein S40293_04683 [Stachybotrys chartarum IBT 40293]|nr:hypothetical protein S40293_04683 [Stachybotrys chartarum IBT 40293]
MELQGHNLSAVALSPYEWSVEFSKGQPKAYRPQNAPWVTKGPQEESGSETAQRRSPTTVDELIQRFLTVLGDSRMPHKPSRYQSLELEAFCKPGSLDVLEQGTEDCVNYALALLDDRSRQGYQALPPTVAGQQRRSRGPLNSFQLLQELRKKRYECEGEPNAARRLLYITNPDTWAILALTLTASRDQAFFLADFFYKYLGNKTALGIRVPPIGLPLFCLEFHFQFYVWQEGGPLKRDRRTKRNNKPVRRSFELQHLGLDEPLKAYVHEAQISCLGDSSCEDVEYYHSQRDGDMQTDPLTAGTLDANLPIWTPREYFLTIYECRLKQVKHAVHNLVSRLLLKLEPYLHDRQSLSSLPDNDYMMSFDRKKQLQQMLDEASRLLRQTIHSICRIIDTWDRFSSRDAAYLSDIVRHRGASDESIPPFRLVAIIGDHINDLRELRLRAEEQQDLCVGLARELEMQIVMEDNQITTQQHQTGELVKVLTGIGLFFLPLTTTTALFRISLSTPKLEEATISPRTSCTSVVVRERSIYFNDLLNSRFGGK